MREHRTEDDVLFLSAADVHASLSCDACFAAVRQAMIAHSSGVTRHLLRSFIGMGEGRTFAQMPAALSIDGYFGAKLVSVFADPADPAHHAHRGLVVLFEGESGAPVCVADAGAITKLRTGAASAVATGALARPDARVLAILGTGHQAESHVLALSRVREFHTVRVWGRNPERLAAFIRRMADATKHSIEPAASAPEAVADADVVCTVTSASQPILRGEWLAKGSHVNIVGSSAPGPVEVDDALVVNSRFFVDCREHVIRHGAEFLRAKSAGLIDDDHIVAEIGEVLRGQHPGRQGADEITVYKSLGHAVQDLAAVACLYEQACGKASA
ncbi:MAG: ornithine cyclodeaminase family protein [Woeseiaceae bacterium]